MQSELQRLYNNASVLIVDDEMMNREVIKECLQGEFQIYTASCGQEALEIARRKLPDLILLDIMMPEMDGWQVSTTIKSDPALQHIPIIFVTSSEHDDLQIRCWKAGCVDFIVKPVNFVTLEHRVKTHVLHKLQSNILLSMTMLDPLTQIPNRRALDNDYAFISAQCRRNQSPMAVLMADLDFFKSYNDFYGHIAGDEALVAISQRLRQSLLRSTDKVYRYGGEEFAIVLSDTDYQGMQKIIERIFDQIDKAALKHAKSPFEKVTLSIGGVIYSSTNTPSHLKEALALADNALYQAKNSGRNTSCLNSFD